VNFFSWLKAGGQATKPASARLAVEALEDRFVPSGTPLDLTTAGAFGQINGAVFEQASPQPTGCGVIHDFVRLQAHGAGATVEQGYNSNARPVQFDEKQSPPFDRALPLSEVPVVTIGGVLYREFLLGINQSSSSPLLSLDQLKIFVSGSATLSGYNAQTGTLAGLNPIYDLDAAGDNYVKLDASLSHGNGSGDMFLYVPDSLFGPAGSNPNVYLYSRFGDTFAANGGFEQWAVRGQAAVNASLGSIGGTVFDATNPNAPTPLGGVTLDLLNAQGVIVATTTTAPNGTYSFTGLMTGLGNLSTYTVVQEPFTSSQTGQSYTLLTSPQTITLAQPAQQTQNVDFFDALAPTGFGILA